MIAENKAAEATGRAIPYNDAQFFAIADEIEAVAESLKKYYADNNLL